MTDLRERLEWMRVVCRTRVRMPPWNQIEALLDVAEAAQDATTTEGEAAVQAWTALANALSRLSTAIGGQHE